MMQTSGNDSFREELIFAIVKNGFEPWLGNANWNAVAEILDTTPERARGQYRRLSSYLKDRGLYMENYASEIMAYPPEIEVEQIDVPQITNDAFDALVEASGVDTEMFQVEKGSVWGSTHNMSASFKFERRIIPTVRQIDNIVKELIEFSPDSFEAYRYDEGENIAILSLYDIQLGRMGFDGTGTKYTVDGYKRVLAELEVDMNRYKLEEIVFVLGNDFSNYDNVMGSTTAGTAQENDVSWKFGIDEQVNLAVYTINSLRRYAPVRVIMVSGNHDRYSNYFLGKTIEGWFRECDDVVVDNEHDYRKYFRYGSTGFMFTHGNSENKNMLPAIFAKEGEKKLKGVFSDTDNQEVHMGHYHQRKDYFQTVTEEFGIYVRTLPSLSASSDWESMKAFILHNRVGIAHIYNKEKGQVAEFYGKIE